MLIVLRSLKDWAAKTSPQMPNLESKIERVEDARHFASLNILSGFDYLPVHKKSQKYFIFVTQEGSYSMIGSPIFQARILEEVLKPVGISSGLTILYSMRIHSTIS